MYLREKTSGIKMILIFGMVFIQGALTAAVTEAQTLAAIRSNLRAKTAREKNQLSRFFPAEQSRRQSPSRQLNIPSRRFGRHARARCREVHTRLVLKHLNQQVDWVYLLQFSRLALIVIQRFSRGVDLARALLRVLRADGVHHRPGQPAVQQHRQHCKRSRQVESSIRD